jgi:ParB family chromosome partitioning protein
VDMKEEVIEIDMQKIKEPEKMVRDSIDPEHIRELAESIREQGLINPITVWQRDGKYEIIAGHCRYLAHRLLGKTKIKAIVKENIDEQTVYILRAIENIQRRNLNPVEEAKIYKSLRDAGVSVVDIARKLGISQRKVFEHLQILNTPEFVQDAIRQGKISVRAAVQLLRIEDEVQREYYFRYAIENGINEKIAKQWVQDWMLTRSAEYYAKIAEEGIASGEVTITPTYVTCQACNGPEEMSRAKYVLMCERCYREFIKALKEI